MKTQTQFHQDIIDHALAGLLQNPEGVYGCDLHNELFNMDYFVIGYYNAEKFLTEWGGSWKAIHKVRSYEESMFCKVNTDLSNCEEVANMIAYIEGELLLFECPTMKKCWDSRLTEEDINNIIDEIKSI